MLSIAATAALPSPEPLATTTIPAALATPLSTAATMSWLRPRQLLRDDSSAYW